MFNMLPGQYILDGHTPVREDDLLKWGMWMQTADRTVAKTDIGDAYISTVFLGLDHDWSGTRPLLFETMVFGGKLDGEQYRYSTWTEAEEGHAVMVQRVRDESPTAVESGNLEWPDDLDEWHIIGNAIEKKE